MEVEPAYGTEATPSGPGEFPFTRGLYPTGYRGRTWTIRQFAGLRQRRADQRALQDDPRPRRRRAVGRLRHADADGPRLRRPARLGEVGHCGVAIDSAADMDVLFDGHPARRRHHVDDDQRPRRTRLLHVPRRRRAPGRRPGRAQRHPADRHLQGVHRPEGVAVRARAAPAADRRPDGVLRREDPGLQAALGVRLPHPRGRLDGRAGARVHAGRRLRLRRARAVARPRRRRVRARACRSSSTPTSTSSRRSPSSAPPAGSGRAGCATSTARRPRRRSGCASTPRPPASR